MSDENVFKDLITAVKVPAEITQAALHPAATEIGVGLGNLFNIVFAPIEKLKIKKDAEIQNYRSEIEKEVSKIPQDNLIEPSLSIVGPALEASKYYIENEEIRSLFSKLIASSMNTDKTSIAHPAFIEIIKQLTPDEAKFFKTLGNHSNPLLSLKMKFGPNNERFEMAISCFSDIPYKIGCVNPHLSPAYIQNLGRLGLIDISYTSKRSNDSEYDSLLNHPLIKNINTEITVINRQTEFVKHIFQRSEFGRKFYEACILE